MILILLMLAVAGTQPATEPEAPAQSAPLVLEQGEFDPGAWDGILNMHVHHGMLDYGAVTPDQIAALDAMLKAAGTFKLTSTFGKEPRAAFVINVYNAWAARQILSHPEAKALGDIPGFFDARTVKIAGEERTLNDIEAMLPAVLPEIRLTAFCLSPGGAGYPLLPARAFTGGSLVELSEDCLREYMNRPVFGLNEETRVVSLPTVVKRHRAWFDGAERGMLGVIGAELPVSTLIALNSAGAKILYPEPDPVISGRGTAESERGTDPDSTPD